MPPNDEWVTADDGCRLWAGAVGSGPPLILCHGGPGLWDMFGGEGGVAEALATTSRVIRWDQRGGGRSERRGPFSIARMVADLDAVRRHFRLDRAAVLGHSWGARLALEYALALPERVTTLVYVAGTGLGWGWSEEYRANLTRRLGATHARWAELRDRGDARTDAEEREHAVLQWSAEFTDPAPAREYAEAMATPWFPINYACNAALGAEMRARSEVDLIAACRRLDVPTLIVDGELDIRPRWAVDSLAAALPEVARVRLPDAGHLPWLDDPEPFYAALRAHLAGDGQAVRGATSPDW